MAKPNSQKTTKTNKQEPQQHHYIRTTFAALFGFLAVILLIASVLVVWLGGTLTNTDQYVKTVGPLVDKPDIQNFIVEKATDGLLENDEAPIQDIANELLGEGRATNLPIEQFKLQVRPIIERNLASVVKSQQFANVWKTSNKDIHSQLINQLNSDKQELTLNFRPVIDGAINSLSGTQLEFVKEKIELKEDAGTLKFEAQNLNNLRKVYDYVKKAMVMIVLCSLLAIILCVLISVHHLKTLRRVTVAVGVVAAILAAGLSSTSLISFNGADPLQKGATVALINSLTSQLRLSLIIISVVCLLIALTSKLYDKGVFARIMPSRKTASK